MIKLYVYYRIIYEHNDQTMEANKKAKNDDISSVIMYLKEKFNYTDSLISDRIVSRVLDDKHQFVYHEFTFDDTFRFSTFLRAMVNYSKSTSPRIIDFKIGICDGKHISLYNVFVSYDIDTKNYNIHTHNIPDIDIDYDIPFNNVLNINSYNISRLDYDN